jgi:hypothetical protein
MKTKIAIISIVTAVIFALLTVSCAMGPVEITDVVMCKSVDSNYNPVDPTTVFPSGTTDIYAVVKIKNMTPEDKITVKWNYLETGEEANTTEFTTDESFSGNVSFSLTIEEGFPAGNYNAVVYLNGEEFKTLEFSVE